MDEQPDQIPMFPPIEPEPPINEADDLIMEFIYCRGGDPSAPSIAKESGMLYGIRSDYTAYSNDVYMLDIDFHAPRWAMHTRKVRRFRPEFVLVPDFEPYRDKVQIELYIQDLRDLGVPLIGVAPKFYGALEQIPDDDDIVICISIPSEYSGYLPADSELRPGNYHLLGGDIRLQLQEMRRIHAHGGQVVSMDGNKIAMKAAHGQIWDGKRWVEVQQSTIENVRESAHNLMQAIG